MPSWPSSTPTEPDVLGVHFETFVLAQKCATSKSGMPSPSTSATFTDCATLPPDLYVTALGLPKAKRTPAPLSPEPAQALLSAQPFATITCSPPPSTRSATATETGICPPVS